MSLSELPDDRVICLMGPTASGKTDLAIQLAQRLDCELISVDSALVYRGLDIGAAKPDFPHHLVDIRDPAQPYSAADFAADARRLIAEIRGRGRTPLLVGGTMLYFKALLEPLAELPPADPAIRAQIEREAAAHGWPHIHAELAKVDPEAAARIHPNHSQRLSRALEVYRATGIPLTTHHQSEGPESKGSVSIDRAGGLIGSDGTGSIDTDPFDRRVVQLAICPWDRGVLHQRIAQRFAIMMEQGLLEEVAGLQARGGLSPDLPAVRAVGYRQLWQHLDGECTLPEARERALAATRQLAKRQLTWLRKWSDLQWIYTDQAGNVLEKAGSEEERGCAGQPPVELALKYLGADPI